MSYTCIVHGHIEFKGESFFQKNIISWLPLLKKPIRGFYSTRFSEENDLNMAERDMEQQIIGELVRSFGNKICLEKLRLSFEDWRTESEGESKRFEGFTFYRE